MRNIATKKLYDVVAKGPVKQPLRHQVFIKTFEISFCQFAFRVLHAHLTALGGIDGLLRHRLPESHLQLFLDSGRTLRGLRHRLLPLSSTLEIRCLDRFVQVQQLLERLRLGGHRIGVTGGDRPKSSVHHGHFPALEK